MTQNKTTKKALLLSILSLVVCVSMLVGSTFAWFTDSVSTGVNKIVAGNLGIELSYKNGATNGYENVEAKTNLFVDLEGNDILWEPGAAAVCYFKLENKGTLDLQYQLMVTYKDTVTYTNASGVEIKLSEALKSAIIDLDANGTEYATREDAVAAAEASTVNALGHTSEKTEMESKTTKYFAMVIWMPTSVDNTYNLPAGARALEVQLGLDVVATQVNSENDSFGNTYDEFPEWPTVPDRVFVAEVLPYTSEEIYRENVKEDWSYRIPAGAIIPAESNPNPTSIEVGLETVNGTVKFTLKDEKGNALTLNEGKAATIKVIVGLGIENVKVNGVPATYIANNGYVSFAAAQPGDYTITYDYANAINVRTPEEFLEATSTFASGDTIALAADINMTGYTWKGINLGSKSLTILGNGHTITGLNNTVTADDNNGMGIGGLVNELRANTFVLKNIVLDGVTVNGTTNEYVGGVIGYADTVKNITMENVTIKNANLTGENYVGGFVAYNSGYSNLDDGAVFARCTFTNCSLIDSTLTGGGSTGGVVAHAGSNPYTVNEIDNFKATGNTITTTDVKSGTTDLRTDKVGIVVGTANIGEVVITNCEASDFSNNTVCGTENSNVIVGRLSTSQGNGSLEINGTKYTSDKNIFEIA